MVGPVFSNVLGAIMKPVTEANVILISPNAGSSAFAGKDCNPNFFVTSYQNDQVHEVSGQYAKDAGIKKVIIIVANYQAGKDAARASSTNLTARFSTKSMCRSASSTIRQRCPDRRGKPRSDFRVPSGRHGREFRQAIPPGWPCRQNSRSFRLHRR